MIAKGMRILCLALLSLYVVSCYATRDGKTNIKVKRTSENNNHFEQDALAFILSEIEIVHSKNIIINNNYDLQGKELVLKEGCTLVFKGGTFRNGTIRGNNTKIKYNNGIIFDNIKITGTWEVKNITTDMFRDLSYVNSLADVLALTNNAVDNHVEVKDYGYDYLVNVSSVGVYEAPLKINSNTDVQLDGSICLLENNLYQYRILMLKDCQNVKICGHGSIKGDRATHDYAIDEGHKAWKSHEWGHGIKIANCQNIEISGISVYDCTGDSFNIGENSENILLYGVTAEGSRRQGVTIAVASNVTIDKCFFQNIGKDDGTAPGAAIDVEPDNTECEIKNILIRGCKIKNCRNGIVSYSKGYGTAWAEKVACEPVVRKEGRHYVNIIVKDCSIQSSHVAFSLIGWDKGEILDCIISDVDFFLRAPKNITVKGNVIDCNCFITNNTCLENCNISDNELVLKNNSELTLKHSIWNNNNVSDKSRISILVEEL